MLIVTDTEHTEIVNMSNVFHIEEDTVSEGVNLVAYGYDMFVVLGRYKNGKEACNAKNRILTAYVNGEPMCRL